MQSSLNAKLMFFIHRPQRSCNFELGYLHHEGYTNSQTKKINNARAEHIKHICTEIFPWIPNRDYQLDFSLYSFQCYNTYLYMPKHPIPWTEKPSRPIPCAKIMHKTIGRFAQPNIGSTKKKSRGATPDAAQSAQ